MKSRIAIGSWLLIAALAACGDDSSPGDGDGDGDGDAGANASGDGGSGGTGAQSGAGVGGRGEGGSGGSGGKSGDDDNNATSDDEKRSIGGTVSGLGSGRITLKNNAGDDLEVAQDGTFTFHTTLAEGSAYEVTIATAPEGRDCKLTKAKGTTGGSNVTDVNIACYERLTLAARARPGSVSLSWNNNGASSYTAWAFDRADCNLDDPAACGNALKKDNASSPFVWDGLENGKVYFFAVLGSHPDEFETRSTVWGARPNAAAFDKSVNAIARGGDGTIYVGGAFNSVGAYTGPLVPLDKTHGVPSRLPGFEVFAAGASGSISAIVPDSKGGYYVAGRFDLRVGDNELIRNLAHVTNTGAVDKMWRPAPGPDNAVVRSIALSSGKVFLAGSFTTVGTGPDNGRASGLAAVSATGTGALESWNPNPTPVNSIEALLATADKIYVAGGFENIGATPAPRVGLAAINISDGEETEWNPDLRTGTGPGRARAIALGKDALYVAGAFDHVGEAAHDRLAAVSLSGTGAATGFTATFTANTDVTTLAVAADALYLGGNFTTVNSDSRSRLAALDLGSGAVQSWNPGADSVVQAITVSGDTVYVAGDFKNIASKGRKYLAAIDKSGKLVESWDPRPSGATKAIAADDDTVYVSGDNVVTYGAEPYARLAAFKGDGRSLTTWTAAVGGGEVLALAVSGTNVYVAGSFNKVGTEDRNGVAVLNDSAAVSGWNAGLSPGASVHALAVSSDTVYLGGLFTKSTGNRSNIVALKTSDATIPGSWALMASVSGGGNGLVEALALDGSTLYVGGDFGMIGPARARLAALNAATGAANDWDPNAGGGAVHALSVVGNVVFVGGEFEELGGDAHAALGAINKTSGVANAQWPPAVAADPHVRAIVAENEVLYVGGRFSTVGTGNGNKHERVVVFDTKASPYATLGGAPDIQGTGVNAVLWDNGKLYLGGNFISASGVTCINFCVTAFSPPPP